MKKILICTALALSSTFSVAGTISQDTAANENGEHAIQFDKLPRVLIFNDPRNSMTDDGQLLVCLRRFNANQYGTCTDSNGNNAWSLGENAIPGFKLDSYEFRFAGSGGYSGGYRTLILYFKKK